MMSKRLFIACHKMLSCLHQTRQILNFWVSFVIIIIKVKSHGVTEIQKTRTYQRKMMAAIFGRKQFPFENSILRLLSDKKHMYSSLVDNVCQKLIIFRFQSHFKHFFLSTTFDLDTLSYLVCSLVSSSCWLNCINGCVATGCGRSAFYLLLGETLLIFHIILIFGLTLMTLD